MLGWRWSWLKMIDRRVGLCDRLMICLRFFDWLTRWNLWRCRFRFLLVLDFFYNMQKSKTYASDEEQGREGLLTVCSENFFKCFSVGPNCSHPINLLLELLLHWFFAINMNKLQKLILCAKNSSLFILALFKTFSKSTSYWDPLIRYRMIFFRDLHF